tara:strand:+ start:10740 stop:11141 length:402 start_codon:yes stop_codon:yes gene_type:complete
MSFAQLYWNNSDIKMEKTKITEKNALLEKSIERNMNIKSLLDENNIFNSFPKNKDVNINMTNFRESIEINLEGRHNNRDIMEKRLNKREKLKNGWFNPFLLNNKYVDDLNAENNYLRPKNTYRENKRMDEQEK